MVAVERARLVARADADLEGEHARARVPGLAQEAQPEARLGRERGGRSGAELARGGQQEHVGVGDRVRELDEVAGVQPAALEVDGAAERLERGADDDVAVAALVAGPGVPRSLRSLTVRRLAVSGPARRRAVALGLEERDDVGDAAAEQAYAQAATRSGTAVSSPPAYRSDADAVRPGVVSALRSSRLHPP